MRAYFYLSDLTNLKIKTAFKLTSKHKHLTFITNVKAIGAVKHTNWMRQGKNLKRKSIC